ncbi:hypothetical protein ACHAXN_001196, partial [Cyclotella atomus]
ARDVNASYKPPASYEISGHLLDSTFSTYYDNGKEQLLREAEVFGIAIGGDGATIDKCPLFNAIACSPSNPSMVLDVFDCSEHAAAGKKKDAAFILRTMLPKMEEIDPQKKYIDLITFDGAGNVQNAAKLLAIHFPRASIGPAVEHVVSLMFDKVMRLRPISELCHIAKWIRNIFGAQRHAPRSHYIKISKVNNNGRPVDFIKPSACRMGGECIQLLRIYRIKETLDECINSKIFADLGSNFSPLKSLLKLDEYWDYHYSICLLLYPLYKLLRLADKRLGVIDMVKYLIRVIDKRLEPSLDDVCSKWRKAPVVKLSGLKLVKYKTIKTGNRGKAKTEGLQPSYDGDESDDESSDDDSAASDCESVAEGDDAPKPSVLMDCKKRKSGQKSEKVSQKN